MIEDTRQLDDATLVQLAGRLDAAVAPEVKLQLQEVISSGGRKLILSLRDVEFIDSAGLGVLVSCLRRCVAAGGDVCLAEVPELIRSILELTRLTRVFRIAQSQTEAVRILRENQQ